MITNHPSRIAAVIATTLFPVTTAVAQEEEASRATGTDVRVIDRSLETRIGDPVRIDEARVLVFDGLPGLPTILPIEDVLAIAIGPVTSRETTLSDRSADARAGDDVSIASPYLDLVDGQRIPGSLSPGDDGRPVWRSAWLKDISFDLDRISQVRFSADAGAVPRATEADIVVLTNGDRLEGLVDDMGLEVTIEVDGPDGDPDMVRVPLDRVASISLVNPMEAPVGAMTWLRGGHRILSESVRIADDGYVTLIGPKVGGDVAEIPIDFLVATVLDASRVLPLADQKIVSLDAGSSDALRPWVPEPKPSPGQHAFSAPPIRLDGPLRVTFDLPSDGGRFSTTIERPMELGPGRMTVRVLDDGRPIRSVVVDRDDPVHRIVVDFESDCLGIEIESGEDGPFQDSIVLREAIIVRPRE